MKQPNNAVESSNKKHNGIIGFWKKYTNWCSCKVHLEGVLLMFWHEEEEDEQTYKLH